MKVFKDYKYAEKWTEKKVLMAIQLYEMFHKN